MATCDNSFRFPRNPYPNMEICDKYGVVWKYDATINNWVGAGTVAPPPVVTAKNDGLITPEIKKKLDYLRSVSAPERPTLKIYPGTDAYWYYLRSNNKTIRFQPESEETLRIEVDHGRLYQLLYKVGQCPGPRGLDGDRGPSGSNGVPAPDELCFIPSAYEDLKLDFAIYVPTPLTLDGPIFLPNCHVPEVSVRLFEIRRPWDIVTNAEACEDQITALARAYKEIPEESAKVSALAKRQLLDDNLCGIKLSQVLRNIPVGSELQELWSVDIQVDITENKVTILDAAPYIDADKTKENITWDAENNIVCGSIFLKENAPDPFNSTKGWNKLYPTYTGWCLKARQKGPDGLPGDDADCRIKISVDDVSNDAVIASSPIVNVRYDKTNRTLYYRTVDIITEYCADKVFALPNSDLLADKPVVESEYASVEITLDECKKLARSTISPPPTTKPTLNFVKWTPQGGCITTRYFTSIKYDWNATLAVNNKYPFPIQYPADKSNPEDCCKEDFFYCNNVQEGACAPENAAS